MGFDKDSGKGLRRLCAACVIAGVALAPWSHWVAPALAGFGIGIGVPLWLRRSWREILKPLREKLLELSGAHRAQPATANDPTGHAREESPEPSVHQPYFSHAWSSPDHERQALRETRLRPQYSIRLAADGAGVGLSTVHADAPERERLESGVETGVSTDRANISKHEQPGTVDPAPLAAPREVIDLPSIMGYLEKRYRDKRHDSRTQAAEQPTDRQPPVMVTMEEVHRRLRASHGGRPPGGDRPSPSMQAGESPRGAAFGAGEKGAGSFNIPAARLVAPAGSPRVMTKPLEGAAWTYRPAFQPHGDQEVTIDIVARDPRAVHGVQSSEDAPPPEKAWSLPVPVEPPALPSSEPAFPAGGSGISIKGSNGGSNGSVMNGGPEIRPIPGECPPVYPNPLRESEPVPAMEQRHEPPATPGEQIAPRAPDNGSNPFRPRFQGDLCLPPLSLLHPAGSEVAPMSQDDLIDGGILIEEKLAEFRVKVNVQDAYAGPVITRYEVQPAVGVRGGQVVSLMKDLARALGLAAIRVVETIPGKTCMGLELPNPRRQMIHLSEVLSSEVYRAHTSKLAMVLGKDIIGEPVVADLARAPHMLVAGTTGSGKSVGINAMILSLLYRATPDEVRFVMIDPKMLELSIYDGIPHLLAPVVTDMKLAANALNWCVWEMERRYRLMSGLRVRNIAGYNQKVRESLDAGEPLFDSATLAQEDPTPLSPLPYIVVVVDELADLMMVTGKKIEELIARLAQKARAAGIHLIIATQRPSVDVITGLIKANIPTRIAFQVSSKIDSRTILDQMGAECLLGQGDMLYLPPGTGYPLRVHGAFVADEEVQAVAEYLKQFGEPQYVEGVLGGMPDGEDAVAEVERFGEDSDPLYDDAVEFVINSRRASISAVQRQLRIGYNRAARLVEQMEASGLVSPMESNGNRTVLVPARQE